MALYSTPLSEAAKTRLIDFVEAYIESLKTEAVDVRAEIAKKKAVSVLNNTDIDILFFVNTINIMYSQPGLELVLSAMNGLMSSRDIAIALVDIANQAHIIDKRNRIAGRQ